MPTRRLVFHIHLLLLFLVPVSAEARQTGFPCGDVVAPKSVGLDAQALTRIDETAEQWIEQAKLVGCSAMILKDGKVAYCKCWGQQDRENGSELNRATIFRIYSMTKPITSVAAMQLVEEGQIGLDERVSKYLPEFANLEVFGRRDNVPLQRAMTVRDLLTHTSGLSYGLFGDTAVDKEYRRTGVLMMDRDLQHMVEKLGKIPLLRQPGTRFHYSVSTDVLGRVIEVAADTTLADYFAENIFEPLGMTDSSFMVPADKRSRFAQMYVPDKKSDRLEPAAQWESFRFHNQANRFFSGGAGVCGTIDDYGRFAQMLASGGELDGVRILKPETLEQMYTNQLDQVRQPPRSGFQFGLGFSIDDRGKHGTDYSWGGAAGTRFWSNPDRNMAVLFMTQIKPAPEKFGETIRDLAYAALTE